MRTFVLGALLAVAASGAAHAQSDDFNRPDAASLGANWTDQAGGMSILSNTAIRTGQAFGTSLATFNGSSGNTITFDLVAGASGAQFGGAVFGWNGSLDNYFIKVQANSGAEFDRFGFYRGLNDNGGGSLPIELLSASFTQASVTASFVGTLATLTINPLGGVQQVYTFDYGFAPSGTTNGLGIFGTTRVDNFVSGGTVERGVPEPATWALLIFGFAGIGAAMRARRSVTVRYA